MSVWLTKAKQKKKERDKRRDLEYCYRKLLREKVCEALCSAKKKIEKKTLYRLEIRPNLSSVEVFVSHQERKAVSANHLHFKLTACRDGIFLMYGHTPTNTQVGLPPVNPTTYSKPELISTKANLDIITEWIDKAEKMGDQSMQLSESQAETEMKKGTGFCETNWRILLCCHFRRLLRMLCFS